MTWQDDYYAGSSDYPSTGAEDDLPAIDGRYFDAWDDPALERDEDAE